MQTKGLKRHFHDAEYAKSTEIMLAAGHDDDAKVAHVSSIAGSRKRRRLLEAVARGGDKKKRENDANIVGFEVSPTRFVL